MSDLFDDLEVSAAKVTLTPNRWIHRVATRWAILQAQSPDPEEGDAALLAYLDAGAAGKLESPERLAAWLHRAGAPDLVEDANHLAPPAVRRVRSLTSAEAAGARLYLERLPEGAIIAGGYARDLVYGDDPHDVDAFVAADGPLEGLTRVEALAGLRYRVHRQGYGRIFRVGADSIGYHRDPVDLYPDDEGAPVGVVAVQVVEVYNGRTPLGRTPLDLIYRFDAPLSQIWIAPSADGGLDLYEIDDGPDDGPGKGATYTYNVLTAYGPIRWLARATAMAGRGFTVDPIAVGLVAWYASRRITGGQPDWPIRSIADKGKIGSGDDGVAAGVDLDDPDAPERRPHYTPEQLNPLDESKLEDMP